MEVATQLRYQVKIRQPLTCSPHVMKAIRTQLLDDRLIPGKPVKMIVRFRGIGQEPGPLSGSRVCVSSAGSTANLGIQPPLQALCSSIGLPKHNPCGFERHPLVQIQPPTASHPTYTAMS
jgi:hypothetical protein